MQIEASQHWQQEIAVLEARSEVERIASYDSALTDYAASIAVQTDSIERIRKLLDLTSFYHREFGVHFEKRYAYREQLHRVLAGELHSIDEARTEARHQYAIAVGFGLPEFERIARATPAELPKL